MQNISAFFMQKCFADFISINIIFLLDTLIITIFAEFYGKRLYSMSTNSVKKIPYNKLHV